MEDSQDTSSKPPTPTSKQLSATAIISEGWRLTYGIKGKVCLRLAWIFLAITGVIFACGAFLLILATALLGANISELIQVGPWLLLYLYTPAGLSLALLLQACIFIASIYMTIPLIILGIRKSVNLPTDMKSIKIECAAVKNNLIGILAIYFIAGTIFSIIIAMMQANPALSTLAILIYIPISLMFLTIFLFAIPLIVIKKIGYRAALSEGFKKLLKNWLPIYLAMALYILISLLGLLIIFLPWTITLFFTTSGIIFRDVYGMKIRENKAEE